MKGLTAEFKVGLFAIVALGTLAYMLFVLSPDSFERDAVKKYYTIIQDAKGVIPKTQVKTNGVTVGKVVSYALQDNRTRIDLEVSKDVQIPVGSTIEIRTKGILGDVFLEIIRPADSGELIKDGGFIPVAESSADLQALMKIVGSIALDVKKVTSTLADVLGTEEGKRSVEDILQNVRTFTADLREVSQQNKAGLTSLIDNLNETTGTLRRVLGNNEGELNDIVKNVKVASDDLRLVSASLRDLLDDENRGKIDRIIANLDDSMVEVKGVAKKINEGQGSLGRLVNDDKVLVEIEGAIKDIREVLAPATKLQITVDYHNEFRSDSTSQHYFNMLFRTRPDKFFLVGLTDREEDEITTTTYPDAVDSEGRTVQKKNEKSLDALRINLQYGRRFYFAQVRFGLFETTGGFAGDLYFLDDRLKFTFEAFDWKMKDNPERRVAHLKAYTSVLFYNHIYLLAGVDDITRTDPDTGKQDDLNYYFGAGLTFDDNDLKAIFGTAALVQ